MILKNIIRIAVLAILAGPANGQGAIVYGRIRDTVLQKNCSNAIIILLQADASVIEKTKANDSGYFKFTSAVPSRYYTLQIIHPAFEVYTSRLHVPNSESFDIGMIYLQPRGDTLTAAMVTRNQLMPRFKGDTLEYNTEKVQLRPYARVEDLLQLLPGLQIDADGNILYNGKKVRHLLIDGEDVIGLSPTLITKNLNGNKVARVQVLDRKSDNAVFTGVDDGARTKTINLVLKDSARYSYSGNVEFGGDNNGYYDSKAFLASFRGKEQISAVGLASNVGNVSVSDKKGSTANGIIVLNQAIDPFRAIAGPGIPQIIGGALHYANTWNDQSEHVNGGYQYGYINNNPINTTQTIQTLPDSVYAQDQLQHSRNIENQQKGNVRLDYKLSGSSALRFSFDEGYTTGQDQLGAAGTSQFNGVLVNTSQRSIQAQLNNQTINGEVGWRLSSANHPSRVFAILGGIGKLDNTSKGYLYSSETYFQPNGLPVANDTTDERKDVVDRTVNYTADLAYTESLLSNTVLSLEYKATEGLDNSQQSTFNRENGKYDIYIDSLSSQFHNRSINSQATITIQGNARHLRYIFGGDWFTYNFRQKDVLNDTSSSYGYGYLAPKMRLEFLVSPRFTLNVDYRVSTQLPSPDQLSPVLNNNDPLHIKIGNPGLKPTFNRSLNFTLSFIKTWMFFANANLTVTDKSITMRTGTDSLGRQFSEPVNVAGGKSGALNLSATKSILGVNVSFVVFSSYSRAVNFVNTAQSNNDYYNNAVTVFLRKNVRNKFSFQLTGSIGQIDQTSSINTNAPVRYWLQSHNGSVSLYSIRRYEFNTNFDYIWQEKTNVFNENSSTFIWNCYIRRNFIHDKLGVRASINNLLNESNGINRTSAQNVNIQTYNNMLGRYWMLSVIYNFDKTLNGKHH